MYRITDLGTLGGPPPLGWDSKRPWKEGALATAINDAGLVVGGSWTAPTPQDLSQRYHAFLWNPSDPMVDLDLLHQWPWQTSVAFGLTGPSEADYPQVVGGSALLIQPPWGHAFCNNAFLLPQPEKLTDLDPDSPGAPDTYLTGIARGVNGAQVVGHTQPVRLHPSLQEQPSVAVFWDHFAPSPQPLATLGFPGSKAAAINHKGEIVGRVAIDGANFVGCLWTSSKDSPQLLAPPQNGSNSQQSYARAINNAGQAVGVYGNDVGDDVSQPSKARYACLWRTDGPVPLVAREAEDLWTESIPPLSYAYGLNDGGDIVGAYSPDLTDPATTVAFIYNKRWGGVPINLNDLIDPSFLWVLIEARGINNKGEIVAEGNLKTNSKGPPHHAFLLSPI